MLTKLAVRDSSGKEFIFNVENYDIHAFDVFPLAEPSAALFGPKYFAWGSELDRQ